MGILDPIKNLLLGLLTFFHDYVGDYGVAIILLTVSVRVVLLPLTVKQMKSMQAMKEIQPEIKKIQEKHKSDKSKQQQEILKFYQENKVNPLSGCLPLLLQMPILFALYQALYNNPVLKGEPFLFFVQDLTLSAGSKGLTAAQAVPYYSLVALMAGTTFVTQKMVSTDPEQDRIMLMMGGVMAVIAWKLPAGVLIYWVTANILQVVQQLVTARYTKARPVGTGKQGAK